MIAYYMASNALGTRNINKTGSQFTPPESSQQIMMQTHKHVQIQ